MHIQAGLILFAFLSASAAFPQASGDRRATMEYRLPGGGDDTVRIFYAAHAGNARDLQEIATAIRSTADIPRLFVTSAPTAIVLRASTGQVAMAEWLMQHLDVAAPPGSGRTEYRVAGQPEDVVRIFYLRHAGNEREMQEIATAVRSTTDIKRIFLCGAAKSMTLRGTPAQMGLAEWLVQHLDVPAKQAAVGEE